MMGKLESNNRGMVKTLFLILLSVAGLLACSASDFHSMPVSASTSNAASAPCATRLCVENSLNGTTDWQLPARDPNLPPPSEIEGYASLTSVNRSDTIQFHVRTNYPYTFEIFRLGWYGGTGGRRMSMARGFPPSPQAGRFPCPRDPVTDLVQCSWTPQEDFTIPSDWPSGVYLAKLTANGGTREQNYIHFVVRDDDLPSDHLVQLSVTTYQAYNVWGGASLYDDVFRADPKRAFKVSFNRPYYSPAGQFFMYEHSMVRFLEREGIDVTYCTNVDVHQNPSLLLNHRSFLSVGHDEYWSLAMRNNVTAARNAGVNLGFFSGNTMWWRVRFEPGASGASDRTMVCYKDSPIDPNPRDPYAVSSEPEVRREITWNWNNDNPQAQLLGSDDSVLVPVRDVLKVTRPTHWIFSGTWATTNMCLPSGYVGQEAGTFDPLRAPSGTELVVSSPLRDTREGQSEHGQFTFGNYNGAHTGMTAYTIASGATVVDLPSLQFVWGLDDDSRSHTDTGSYAGPGANAIIQQMTRNILARFAGRALPASITDAEASASKVPCQDAHVVEIHSVNGRCLAAINGNNDGTDLALPNRIQQNICNDDPGQNSSQRWVVNQQSGGYVEIKNIKYDKCLGSDANGNLHLYMCNGGVSQRWRFGGAPGTRSLRIQSELYADLCIGGFANGVNLISCASPWAEIFNYFYLRPADNEYYQLIHDLTNHCVDVPWASTTPGEDIQIHACSQGGAGNQSWSFVRNSRTGYYQIRSQNGNLCLHQTDAPGAKLKQELCDPDDQRQLFLLSLAARANFQILPFPGISRRCLKRAETTNPDGNWLRVEDDCDVADTDSYWHLE